MIHVTKKRGASTTCEVVLGSRFLNVKLRRTSSPKLCANLSKLNEAKEKCVGLQRKRSLTEIVNMVGEELDHLFSSQEVDSSAGDRPTQPQHNLHTGGGSTPVKSEASLKEMVESVGKELEHIITAPDLERNISYRDILQRCADEEVKKGQDASAVTHLVSILEQEYFHETPCVVNESNLKTPVKSRNKRFFPSSSGKRKEKSSETKGEEENYPTSNLRNSGGWTTYDSQDDDGLEAETLSLEASQKRLRIELKLAEIEFDAFSKDKNVSPVRQADPEKLYLNVEMNRNRSRSRRQRRQKRGLPVSRLNIR